MRIELTHTASEAARKRVRHVLLSLFVLLLFSHGSTTTLHAQNETAVRDAGLRPSHSFIENRGQWNDLARYRLSVGGMRAWFVDGGLVYDLIGGDGVRSVVRWSLLGAHPVRPNGRMKEATWRSWIIGKTVIEDVPAYAELHYPELLPGVDARFNLRDGLLKYDLIVAPGVDPASLRMRYDGAEKMEIDRSGALSVRTAAGILVEAPPEVWQEIDGERRLVDARFVLDGETIGIALGSYDSSYPLVIDPAIRFSSYLGGNGFDEGRGVTLDRAGNVYVVGQTRSEDFPVLRQLEPPLRDNPNSSRDLFVAKFDPTGQRQIWGTYIGGNGDDDPIAGVRITSDGFVIVAGVTRSNNFPTTSNVFMPTTHGPIDGFVLSLGQSEGGTRVAQAWGTYVGGPVNDSITSFDLNSADNVVVTGHTTSPTLASEFPSGGLDSTPSPMNNPDAFVAVLSNDGRQLVAGTLLGGDSEDRAADVAVTADDRIVVIGSTRSNDFPTTSNAISTARSALTDGFVVQLSPDLSTLDYGTYFGGIGEDSPRSVAVDLNGMIHVTGNTGSPDFPVTISTPSSGSWFASKIDPTSDTFVYSRYVTSNASDRGASIAVDSQGRGVISGATSSASFPILGGGVTTPGRGKYDIALVRLTADGVGFNQSSVLGGSEDDLPAAHGFLHPAGDLYLTGTTRSRNFPLTRFPFDDTLNTIAGEAEPDAFLLAFSFNPRPNLIGPPLIVMPTLRCDSVVRDTIFVYNDGERPVVITANKFRVEDVGFALEEPEEIPNPSDTVKPGDSLRYIVRFTSVGFGNVENDLWIFKTDPITGQDSLSITIRGERVAPSILVGANSPQAARFGSVLTCSDSTVVVTLNNNNAEDVTVEMPTFVSGGRGYRIVGATFPLVIPGRQERTFRLIFEPNDTGEHRDELIFRVRECDKSIVRLLVLGRGETPLLAGLPDEILFPTLQSCSPEHDTLVTVVNRGRVNLIVRSMEVDGSGFNIEAPGTFPDTLQPNDSIRVSIRFSPSSAGDFTAEALIRIEPCDTTLRVRLVGSHPGDVVPVLSVDTLDFGVLPVCPGDRPSHDSTIAITNPSDSLISLGTPVISTPFGSCGIPFPIRILPNDDASLCLRYDPPPGNRNDTFELLIPYSIGECTDTLRVVLIGGRSVIELTTDPLTIDLPPLDACESFKDTLFVVHNNSISDISIDRIAATRGIEILEPSTPHLVPASDSVILRVRFSPTQSGESSDSIRIFATSAQCSDTLDLIVTGSAGGIVVTTDRDSISFTPILVCDPPSRSFDTLYVSWTGTTTDDVRVTSPRIIGVDSKFSFDAATVDGKIIGAGERLPIPIAFSSGSEGVFHDTLEFIVEPCMDTIRIALAGEAIEPEIDVRDLHFGDVPVLGVKGENLLIGNNSPIPFTIDTIYVAGNPFAFVPGDGFPGLPMTIEPDSVRVLPLTFSPTEAGDFIDSIILVFSNGCERRYTVRITGTGVRLQQDALFCISGVYREPGIVGETVVIPVRTATAIDLDAPVDLVFRFQYDVMRFQFVGVDNGVVVGAPDEIGGTVLVRSDGVISLPGDLPSLRLRLLAGAEPFAVVKLDSVGVVSGNGIEPSLCPDSAIVSIANRCIIVGLLRGAYPNRLERPVPNPANEVVEITFQQLENAETIFRVWDAQGREILRPLEGTLPGGRYTIQFSVQELSPGLYFYGVNAGSWNEVGSMLIHR